MRAQIVKLSNEGEKVMEDQFVLDEDRAMEMFEDYILDDPEMDDYVREQYAAYASGEDKYGREKRIGWLVKNGKISETSVTGKYSLYLYVNDEDEREIDEYYESCMCNERELDNDEIIMYAVEPEKRKMVKELYDDVVRGYPADAFDRLVELLGDKAEDLQENLEFLLRDREAEQHRAATISDWYARSARSGSNMGD